MVLRSISCIDARRLPTIDPGLVLAPTPFDAVALALEDLDRVFNISRMVVVSTGTITSEMIMKCLMANIPVLASTGVTTPFAVEEIGLCIVGSAGTPDMVVYTHAERMEGLVLRCSHIYPKSDNVSGSGRVTLRPPTIGYPALWHPPPRPQGAGAIPGRCRWKAVYGSSLNSHGDTRGNNQRYEDSKTDAEVRVG